MSKSTFDRILYYFPSLSNNQIEQLEKLATIYGEWNEKINVVSRKDFDNFYIHHVLHSLAIYKMIAFKRGTTVLDLGAGGGFPSVPLAIVMPEVHFLAVDSIQKKLKVIDAVIHDLNIQNLKTSWSRVESIPNRFDFVVSRAVAPLSELIYWTRGKYHPISFNKIDNGLITLKGGDLKDEIKETKRKTIIKPISSYFEEEYFDTKFVTYTKL